MPIDDANAFSLVLTDPSGSDRHIIYINKNFSKRI